MKKYCEKCGSELVKSDTRITFDKDTGEKRTDIEYRCPNQKWYDFFYPHSSGYSRSWINNGQIELYQSDYD